MKRRGFFAGLGGAGSVLAVPASAQDSDSIRMVERFAAALSAHDLAAFAALFAADYINHQVSAAAPSPAGISAKQATVDFFASRLRAMPDLLVTIETVLAAPGRAAASFVYTGTQTRTYLGVPATGRELRFTSCDIFTVKGGLFSEHWGMGDIAGVQAQLKHA